MPVTRAAGALVASLSAALLATTLAASPATAAVEEPPRPPFYEAPAALPAAAGDPVNRAVASQRAGRRIGVYKQDRSQAHERSRISIDRQETTWPLQADYAGIADLLHGGAAGAAADRACRAPQAPGRECAGIAPIGRRRAFQWPDAAVVLPAIKRPRGPTIAHVRAGPEQRWRPKSTTLSG